jgi:DNA-binding NarL/FixJ family response regulator
MVKTLIVDDSAVFRASICQVLAARFPSMHIAEATTAFDAVLQARTLKPDLLFIDVRLPDGSGFDLAHIVGATLRDSAICIVGSFDLPECRSAAKACGARHYLGKGTSTGADFIAVVEVILAERFRTLLIEEDDGRRRMLAAALVAHWPRMNLVEADTGPVAFEKIRAYRPDLVLVGAGLLMATAPDLCKLVKKIQPASTIVAVICNVATDDRESAHRAGVDYAVGWNADFNGEITAIVHAALLREGLPLAAAHNRSLRHPGCSGE